MSDIVERLQLFGVWSNRDSHYNPVPVCREAAAEIERLRSALEAIKKATINGDVCDDVAWFDQIETLHDFCERTLGRVGSQPGCGADVDK